MLAFPSTSDALRPLTVTLSALAPLHGLADPLVVEDRAGWISAAELVDGSKLPDLLTAARKRWSAAPHAAATLAWKSYTYWLAMPAVLGWATARRVPLVDADNVLVRLNAGSPLLQIGLRKASVAVLPDDPLAHHATVAPDEAVLLKMLRMSLLEHHLDPLMDRIRDEVKVGRRTLQGSIASGIAYAVIRAGRVLPGSTAEAVTTLLKALDLDDLVDLVPSASGEPGVQRKTCCLAFTLPQPKICTGCCLRSC